MRVDSNLRCAVDEHPPPGARRLVAYEDDRAAGISQTVEEMVHHPAAVRHAARGHDDGRLAAGVQGLGLIDRAHGGEAAIRQRVVLVAGELLVVLTAERMRRDAQLVSVTKGRQWNVPSVLPIYGVAEYYAP